MKRGANTAGLILTAVGIANLAYGIYRGLVLDESMLPLVPLGIVFTLVGVLVGFRR